MTTVHMSTLLCVDSMSNHETVYTVISYMKRGQTWCNTATEQNTSHGVLRYMQLKTNWIHSLTYNNSV